MWLLGNATPEQDIAEAQAKQAEGFDFFKLKIGVKPIATRSTPRMRSAQALPEATLCADANCGLTLAAARRYAERTREAGSPSSSSPCADHDLAGLKALARATGRRSAWTRASMRSPISKQSSAPARRACHSS